MLSPVEALFWAGLLPQPAGRAVGGKADLRGCAGAVSLRESCQSILVYLSDYVELGVLRPGFGKPGQSGETEFSQVSNAGPSSASGGTQCFAKYCDEGYETNAFQVRAGAAGGRPSPGFQ